MILLMDMRSFKKEMRALIDGVGFKEEGWIQPFCYQVMALVEKHKVSTLNGEYPIALVRWIRADQKDKAHNLVDCFNDTALTIMGARIRTAVKVALWGVAGFFIVCLMWLVIREVFL